MSDASILSYNETVATGIRVLRSGRAARAKGGVGVRAYMIFGPPGGGKNSTRDAIARGLGVKHQFMIKLSHHEVVDVAGVPVPNEETKRTHFYPSADMLPPEGLKGGLLVTHDEVGDQNVAQQNLTCQQIFENRIHSYEFPEDTFHLLLSNRVSDRSGSNRIVTKLGNRCSMVTMVTRSDEVFDHGVANGWNAVSLAFLKMHGAELINPSDKRPFAPTYFNSFDPADPAQMQMPQFASARSHDFASSHLNDIEIHEPGLADGYLLGDLASMLGTVVATKLVAFRKVAMTMPDPMAILTGKNVPYPTKQEVLWSLCLTLASKCEKKHVKNLHLWLGQGPDQYLALAARLLFNTKVPQLSGDDFHNLLQDPKLKAMF